MDTEEHVKLHTHSALNKTESKNRPIHKTPSIPFICAPHDDR